MNRKRILLIGGGHAHIEVVRQFQRRFSGLQVEMILVSPEPGSVYSGMMPGVVAGHFPIEDCLINLPSLCDSSGVRWIQDRFIGLDESGHAILAGGNKLRFEYLSLDIGSKPGYEAIAGAPAGMGAKPASDFLHRWQQYVASRSSLSPESHHQVVVVGGGVAAVELILAMCHRLKPGSESFQNPMQSTVGWQLIAGGELLAGHNRWVRGRARNELQQAGVSVKEGVRLQSMDEDYLMLSDGRRIRSDFTLMCTGAKPAVTLFNSTWPVDDGGFIKVNAKLQVQGMDNCFAAGDIASFPQPLQKSGVFAVRQGPVLAKNLAASVRGDSLQPFRPQPHFLKLISLGERRAMASRGWFYASGTWVWRWKNHIDSAFMERYQR